jgi:Tfp pilus assembly protein PilN
MIQFNLLPDVKLKFIRARRQKRVIMLVAGGAAGAALIVLVLLFVVVNVLQKKHLSDLTADIKTYNSKIQNTKDISKILTIQNQLGSLPELHNKKAVASRLSVYITQLTPAQVSMSKFSIDFNAHTITFDGSADSLSTVNKFTDTLKFTTYKAGNKTGNAFSDVVLASFTRGDKDANYQINAKFDPTIFDSANDATLTVPKIISTRSETEKPSALFQEPTPGTGVNQ